MLVAGGHDVTVLCVIGGYAGHTDGDAADSGESGEPSGVRVLRVRATRLGRGSHVGRVLDYASFYFGVAWRLLCMRPRPDRIVALTTPPYLSVLARFLSKLRGADHAHWVMDLYPDVMFAHGMLNESGIPARLLRMLGRWGFGGRRCSAVVSLGPDMSDRVGSYLRPRRDSPFVPLWATAETPCREEQIAEWRDIRGWDKGDLVLLYSGNMGLGHRFEEFLAAARALEGGDWPEVGRVRFVFTGRGKRRAEIEAFQAEYPNAEVELGDYVAREELSVHLASADVHFVSLEPSWDGTMVPSKIQGIFAIGRPVIFVGSRTCSIGRWIVDSGGGWVIEPGRSEDLLRAIQESGDPKERMKRGQAALEFAKQHFDRDRNAGRLARLFGTLEL